MSFPRSKNGWVDDGRPVLNGPGKRLCPNCNSPRFRETISTEKCDACGLECDYWGNGANEIYLATMGRQESLREEEEWHHRQHLDHEKYGDF